MTQPRERDVARHGQREGADRADFLARLRAGGEQVRIGLLQQLIDIGRVACVTMQTGTQHPFELEGRDEIAVGGGSDHGAPMVHILKGAANPLMTDRASLFARSTRPIEYHRGNGRGASAPYNSLGWL